MNARRHGTLTKLFYPHGRWKETRQPDNRGKRRTDWKNSRAADFFVVWDSSLTFTYAKPLNSFLGSLMHQNVVDEVTSLGLRLLLQDS